MSGTRCQDCATPRRPRSPSRHQRRSPCRSQSGRDPVYAVLRGAAARFAATTATDAESATHNPVLRSMIGTARAFEPAYRARSIQAQVIVAGSEVRERVGHHRAILNALLARDAQQVETLMREHQLEAGESYLRYPGPPDPDTSVA